MTDAASYRDYRSIDWRGYRRSGVSHLVDGFYGGTAPRTLHGTLAVGTTHRGGGSTATMELAVFKARPDIGRIVVTDLRTNPPTETEYKK